MNLRSKYKLFVAVATVLPLLLVVPQTKGQQPAPTNYPWIIFVGTVDASNAVSLRSLKASQNTSVVTVEKVFRKPDAITLAPRDRVTVVTDGSSNPLTTGMRALFVTEGSIYGESIAVRVLSWEPAAVSASAREEARAAAKMQQLIEKDLRASLTGTDIIIVGRVKSIQEPSATELLRERQKIREHSPFWQEAIIEVQNTLKGAPAMAEVVVRFPTSMDVLWAGSPKFSVGQEGTFLLQQDRISGVPTATLKGKTVTAYIATNPKHVLPKAHSQTIKKLLNTRP
jgi:hypothetical protein